MIPNAFVIPNVRETGTMPKREELCGPGVGKWNIDRRPGWMVQNNSH
jgi:hypothetical protein